MSELNDYRMPCLEICHPNGRGTGSALRLCLSPATAAEPGFVRLRMADQSGTSGFDWADACSADLGAVDLAKLLMVFQGWIEKTGEDSSGDNRIITDVTDGHVRVDLYHKVDPVHGYVLTLMKPVKGLAKAMMRQIALSSAESLALSTAIQGALHTVAFGVPHAIEEEL